MTPKEKKKRIRDCRTLARQWLSFARGLVEHMVTRPEEERSMWMMAVLDDILRAKDYRDEASSIRTTL